MTQQHQQTQREAEQPGIRVVGDDPADHEHDSAEDRADDAGALPEGDAGGFALHAMIGGALWLMAPLAAALREQGIEAVFAFSVRETEEQKQADGSVRKVAVFRHAGFVPAVA